MALKVGELLLQINLNTTQLNAQLKELEKSVREIGKSFDDINATGQRAIDNLTGQAGRLNSAFVNIAEKADAINAAFQRVQNVSFGNLGTEATAILKATRVRAPTKRTLEKLVAATDVYNKLEQAATSSVNAQISHLTRFENAAKESNARIIQSVRDLTDFRISESARALTAITEGLNRINQAYRSAADFQRNTIREVTTEYLNSQRQIAGFFSRMDRSGPRRFTRAGARAINEQVEATGEIQPAGNVLNRLNSGRQIFNTLNTTLENLNRTIDDFRRTMERCCDRVSGAGRGGFGGRRNQGGGGFGGADDDLLFGGGQGLPRFGGLVGLTAAAFGIFGIADLISNLVQSFRDFTVETITMSNELERTSLSAELVAGNFAEYNELLEIARENQRLFGGTLNDNIQELTGFSLVARTAGVDLEQLTGIAQRLALFDPGQGIGGASIALREYLAGNIRSLRERFELPANVLRSLQAEGISTTEKLERLSRFLDSQGLSLENLADRLDTTSQSYRDLGIAFEEVQIAAGRGLAVFFEPFANALTETFKRLTRDVDQLARDMYNLTLDAQITEAQRLAAQMENAERRTAEYREMIELTANDMAQLVAYSAQNEALAIGTTAGMALFPPQQPENDLTEQQNARLEETYTRIRDLVARFPDITQRIDPIVQAFAESDDQARDLDQFTTAIGNFYEQLIAGPERMNAAIANIRQSVKIPIFDSYKSEIFEILKLNPRLAENVDYLMTAFAQGRIPVEAFVEGLNNIKIAASETSLGMGDIIEVAKSANLQFIESQIEAYETEKAQRKLIDTLNALASSTTLTAGQTELIAQLLGIEGDKVDELISKYRELNNARVLGVDYADEIARIEASGLSPAIQQGAIAGVYQQVIEDFNFDLYASDVEKLAKAEENLTRVRARFGEASNQYIEAYKETELIRSRIAKESGSSRVSSEKDTLSELEDIIRDYQIDTLEAEREYQQKILDIQEEFAEKQKRALERSELGKRRGRVSVYRRLIDSELSQEQQQGISATFETDFSTAMQLAGEGKLEQSQNLIDIAEKIVDTDVSYLEDINKLVEEGDTAKAEALRYLYQQDKDALEIERRNILEGGDPNVDEYNKQMSDAQTEQAQRIDDINLKFKDRAQTLLEKEPEILKLIGGTNLELSKQAEFLQKLAEYTSPVELGLSGIASNADDALAAVKKLIDYMRENNIGAIFTGGIVTGIKQGGSDVVQAAEDVTNDAVEASKDELQARSPSRRTMREVGAPFVQGIVQGISKTSSSLTDAVNKVIGGAVKTAQNGVRDLPTGIRKTQENIDAFKNFIQTNISILEGIRGLMPDRGGAAEGRASYVAEIAKIDQDTEAKITARREKLSRDLLLARTEDERRIIEAIAQQDIALLQQQANIQKAAQQEEMRNVTDQETLNNRLSAIQQQASDRLKALQERMAELARTNPEEAARRYQLQAQRILDVANLRQEIERYMAENNLTMDDAYVSLLRQQIQQVNALASLEIAGTGVGNAPINNTVYNINMDLAGSNLRRDEVRTIVRQELNRALANSRGSTA